jgi:hypothetical protein
LNGATKAALDSPLNELRTHPGVSTAIEVVSKPDGAIKKWMRNESRIQHTTSNRFSVLVFAAVKQLAPQRAHGGQGQCGCQCQRRMNAPTVMSSSAVSVALAGSGASVIGSMIVWKFMSAVVLPVV